MKKIVFFAYDLNIGGIEKALINLLNKLVKYYNVTLVLEKNEGVLSKELSSKVNIIEHKVSSNKNIIIRKSTNFIRRCLFILKHKNKYDFACAYAPYLYSAIKLSLQCSKNTAIYIHTDYSLIYKNKEEFMNFFNTRQITNFKKIVFVSNEGRNNFIKNYPNLKNKTLVINNIINVDEIKKQSEEQIKIKKEKDDIIFTFIGRLEEKAKKVTRLLDCFHIISKQNSNYKLWIIGDGEDYNLYKNYIEKNNLENTIKMFGKQKNPYKYIKLSNFIVITSDYEGVPVVFHEANILNKPILSTLNVSDDYYTIENKGYVISKDPKKMSEEIINLTEKNIKIEQLDYNMINEKRVNKIRRIIENEI